MRKIILTLMISVSMLVVSSFVLAAPASKNSVPTIAVSGGSGLLNANQIKAVLMQNDGVSSIGSVVISGSSIVISNFVIKKVNVSQIIINPNQKTSSAILLLSDIQSSFMASNPDIQNIALSIVGNNQMNVKGKVKLGFISVNLNLTGELYIQNNALYYTCNQAQMNGLGIPRKVVNSILARTNPFFKFSDINIPTYFNAVNFSSNSALLSTSN